MTKLENLRFMMVRKFIGFYYLMLKAETLHI